MYAPFTKTAIWEIAILCKVQLCRHAVSISANSWLIPESHEDLVQILRGFFIYLFFILFYLYLFILFYFFQISQLYYNWHGYIDCIIGYRRGATGPSKSLWCCSRPLVGMVFGLQAGVIRWWFGENLDPTSTLLSTFWRVAAINKAVSQI